jgi:hypothetical protein
MGEKIVKYYELAKEKGGLAMMMKLSFKTCLTQKKAPLEEDTPALVKQFYDALCELTDNDPSIPRL